MKLFNTESIIGIALAVSLVGCSSSDGPTTQDPTVSATPRTAVGRITGFGSIYVNGVEYDTNGASYDVDDASASGDDALAVGMVVKVQGSVNRDGATGKAESIYYDDDVEGIVSDLAAEASDPNIKTFTVMGVLIQADRNSTNFEGEDDPGFSFESMSNGDNVEVSGEFSGDLLVASYIEKQDASDDDFEAKGTVDQYNGDNAFVLVLRNGSMLNVTIAPGAEIPSVGVADGQYVEVEGAITDPIDAPYDILAAKVELEDHDRIGDHDDDEVEIKGMLNIDAESGTWSVMDVTLSFNGGTEYSPADLADRISDESAAGLYVEVEGQYVNDVLEVEKIAIEDGDLEFTGDVQDVTATDTRDGTITLSFGAATGAIEITVTPDTMFRDDDPMVHFDLNSIIMGDKVEVEARQAADGTIYASSLHVEDDYGYEIEGPVDSIDELSISILGVTFGIDMDTFFEGGTPVAGDYVELEDDDADGVADSVELDD